MANIEISKDIQLSWEILDTLKPLRILEPYENSKRLQFEDLEFCINFIVESVLKLQEFDFELKIQ